MGRSTWTACGIMTQKVLKKKKSLSNKILTKMLPNIPLGTVCV